MCVISISIASLIPIISRATDTLTAIFILPVVLAVMCIISYGAGRTEKLLERYVRGDGIISDRIFCILAVILLILQINFAFIQDFVPKNDLSYICTGAENMVRGKALYDGIPEIHGHYFSVYPNNHMIFTLIYILYRIEYILTGDIRNIFPTIINIVSLDVSYIIMYRISRSTDTPERSLMCAVRGLLLTPFITYTAFFYTDSLAMPYVTGAIYFYLRYIDKYRLSDIMICGILTAIGYKFKGSVGLIIPAIILDMLVNRRRNGVKVITLTITVFAVICMIISKITCGVINIDSAELERYKFPLIHWVMMSLHGRGGYCGEDFRYTLSFVGYGNKINADMLRMTEKLSEMGVTGFLMHLSEKTAYTWRDGTYMTGYYNKYRFLESNIFYIIVSALHFRMLYRISRKYITGKFNISEITLIILSMFLLVWETRCRYLVSFFPLLILI